METPIVSFTFLTTQEDYCSYKLDCAKLSCSRRVQTVRTLIGIVLIAGGVTGALLFSNNIFNHLGWGLCIVSGFFAASYFSLFEPLLVSYRAQKEFIQIRDKISAQTVELCESGVHMKNDRAEGFYPYGILHRCIRTEHFILFFFGAGDSVALALRTAQPEELEQAVTILKSNLGERYIDRSV